MGPQATFPGVLRTRRLVGREREKAIIREAIEAEGELRILYIVGDGGIGKTRLLEEVPNILAQCKNRDSCRYGGIFDLYVTELQSNSGLEAATMAALDPVEEGFKDYRARRKEYKKLRQAGGDPKRIEALRKQLEELFVQGFNEISTKARVILCLDTVETIQYESDAVQKVGEIGLTGIEIKDWLLKNLPRLKNVVVILAGRPKPQLAVDFQNGFGGRLQPLEPRPFSEAETLDYFAAVAEVKPTLQQALRKVGLSADQQRVIHHYTAGHPIRIALAIELLIRGLSLPAAFFDSLDKAQSKTGDELNAIRERVEEELVTGIMEASDDIARVLPFVTFARKGINLELLQRLVGEEWSLQRCRRVLNDLKEFSFVKARPGTNWLFLHDEVYDLMDQHLIRRRRGLPDPSLASQIISQYYTEKMKAAKGNTRQNLAVERLYYQLVEKPKDGYAQYAHLSDEAVISHEVGFDMRLRDEMLRTFDKLQKDGHCDGLSRDFIDRDAAVRWVKRYIAQSEYTEAIEVAKRIAKSSLYDPGDVFFTAALATYQGEAMAYLGRDMPGALNLLQQATGQLEMASPRDKYEEWNKDLVLGRGYNDLGYNYVRLKQYENAAAEFVKALPHLRRTGLLSQQADTLKNLAYVYALQGRFDEATVLCRDSLDLWQRSGYRFGEGLAWNVLGIIFLQRGIHDAARIYCNNALRIFRKLQDERGEGLACIALGQALRQEGSRRDVHTLTKAQGFFRQAETALQRAIQIFTGPVQEQPRVVEAYNELGCVYRDWAIALGRFKAPAQEIADKGDAALRYLDDSIRLARAEMRPEAADSWNDKADVYHRQGNLDAAEHCLDESNALVPAEYLIQEGKGMPTIPGAVSGFWEILGKNSLVRGHIFFARGVGESDPAKKREWYQKAVEQYVLAGAYFGRYSSEAPELGDAFRGVYERLKERSVEWLTDLQRYAVEVEGRYAIRPTRIQDVFTRALGIKLAYQNEGGGGAL